MTKAYSLWVHKSEKCQDVGLWVLFAKHGNLFLNCVPFLWLCIELHFRESPFYWNTLREI